MPSWQTKYETLQSGVLRIVPLLEKELKIAKTELETSLQAKKQADELLEKSQSDLSISETERQALKELSARHEGQIELQQKRIAGLVTQLAEVYGLWMSSESSRKNLEEKAALMTARLQEQAQQIAQDQTDKIWIGLGCGAGGVTVGILIYEGIKALINQFSGAN